MVSTLKARFHFQIVWTVMVLSHEHRKSSLRHTSYHSSIFTSPSMLEVPEIKDCGQKAVSTPNPSGACHINDYSPINRMCRGQTK
jgi:hypothetical protein